MRPALEEKPQCGHLGENLGGILVVWEKTLGEILANTAGRKWEKISAKLSWGKPKNVNKPLQTR